jgi:hypothetical protein
VPSEQTLDRRKIAVFFYSDDDGDSWQEAADWVAMPRRSTHGLQEPGVVELRDGRIYAWFRTSLGQQYEAYSMDQGDTWTVPQPSRFYTPLAPMAMKRVPKTGDLMAVWNDHAGLATASPMRKNRSPLALAFSADDGATWSKSRLIETDPEHGYAYTAIHFTDEAVLLAYNCGDYAWGLQDLRIRRLSYDYLAAD